MEMYIMNVHVLRKCTLLMYISAEPQITDYNNVVPGRTAKAQHECFPFNNSVSSQDKLAKTLNC